MQRITKLQKKVLLEKYPNGDAVGQAIIAHFLDEQHILKDPTYTPLAPSDMELNFLLENIVTNEDKVVYNQYVHLHGALAKVTDITVVFEQSFYHGFYRALYLLHPAVIGFSAFLEYHSQASMNFTATCSKLIELLEDVLPSVWENLIRYTLKALYHYDFVIDTMGNVCNLDIQVLRPDMTEPENSFKALQTEMNTLLSILEKYKENTKRNVEKVKISAKTIRMLKAMAQFPLENLGVPEETQQNIRKAAELFQGANGINNGFIDYSMRLL